MAVYLWSLGSHVMGLTFHHLCISCLPGFLAAYYSPWVATRLCCGVKETLTLAWIWVWAWEGWIWVLSISQRGMTTIVPPWTGSAFSGRLCSSKPLNPHLIQVPSTFWCGGCCALEALPVPAKARDIGHSATQGVMEWGPRRLRGSVFPQKHPWEAWH